MAKKRKRELQAGPNRRLRFLTDDEIEGFREDDTPQDLADSILDLITAAYRKSKMTDDAVDAALCIVSEAMAEYYRSQLRVSTQRSGTPHAADPEGAEPVT